MDLHRHIRLLWRSKKLIAAGAIVGILLGILASYKVSGSGLQPRKPAVYTAETKLLLTQNGFPWGRTWLPGTETALDGSTVQDAPKGSKVNFADPARLATLAWMYSHFIMGDAVHSLIKDPPAGMTIDAAPLTAGGNFSSPTLPVILLTVTASSADGAQRLSREVPTALETYLTRQQNSSSTSSSDRVEVSVINRSPMAVAAKSKAMLMTIVIFMMGIAAAVALVYIFENLRLSSRKVETLPERGAAEAGKPATVVAHHDVSGWASGPPSGPTRISSGSR